MCNPNASATSNSTMEATIDQKFPPPPHLYIIRTLIPITKTQKPTATLLAKLPTHDQASSSTLKEEAVSLFGLSFPIALTALLLYSRSIVSMLFLGSLGDLPLAAGSLAIAFANITGYSVLSGLSLGMEPLCSQAFGASQSKLLSLTLRRSILFLLCSSLPISILWLNMSTILLFLGQDKDITSLAQTYILYSLTDLLAFSFIHPIRIFLRSQGITRPLTFAAFLASLLHFPLNLLFVRHFEFGTAGVAAASAASNLLFLLFLLRLSPIMWRRDEEEGPAREYLTGWGPLARLAVPSCVSVCLEWWWYELMIILCGLLPTPKPAVASMGVLIQTTALVYVFPSSLGFGVSARVGNELGAKRPGRARTSAAVAILLSVVMGFVAFGFAAGMKDQWGRMFTDDADILRLTAAALPIVGLCELGNCPQTVGCGVLRGSARPAHAAHVNLGAFYLVGLPVAVGLGFGLNIGFCGLWMGLLAAQIACAALMMYVVGTTDWEAQALRARLLTCAATAAEDDQDRKEGESVCCGPLITTVDIEREMIANL